MSVTVDDGFSHNLLWHNRLQCSKYDGMMVIYVYEHSGITIYVYCIYGSIHLMQKVLCEQRYCHTQWTYF